MASHYNASQTLNTNCRENANNENRQTKHPALKEYANVYTVRTRKKPEDMRKNDDRKKNRGQTQSPKE